MKEIRKEADITEPEIKKEDILILDDKDFVSNNLCIVTGSGSGIGRAMVIASAANNLLTVGLDINEEESIKTQKIVQELGGQMVFIKTDLTKDENIETAIIQAWYY